MSKLYSHSEETQLWEDIATDKEQAFRLVFEHYHSRLYRFGMRYSYDQTLVKDAIQEVFFDLWKQRKQLLPIRNYEAYLTQMLKYKLSKAYKKKKDAQAVNKTNENTFGHSYETLLIAQQENEAKQKNWNVLF